MNPCRYCREGRCEAIGPHPLSPKLYIRCVQDEGHTGAHEINGTSWTAVEGQVFIKHPGPALRRVTAYLEGTKAMGF
jgi:hypothetical protein